MARSTRRAISDLGCTPMMRSTSRPRLKTSSIGMLRTLRRLAVMGSASRRVRGRPTPPRADRPWARSSGTAHTWCPGVHQHRQRRALDLGRERRVAYGRGRCRSGGPHGQRRLASPADGLAARLDPAVRHAVGRAAARQRMRRDSAVMDVSSTPEDCAAGRASTIFPISTMRSESGCARPRAPFVPVTAVGESGASFRGV